MGYIVSEADIPDLPLVETSCEVCNGNGGRVFLTYDKDKNRVETWVPRSCDTCQGQGKITNPRPHLETRRESFVLYSDFGDERIEITYADLPVLEAYVKYLKERYG